jgi:hypothetical protein
MFRRAARCPVFSRIEMKKLILALPILIASAAPSLAAPTQAQKDEFYAVCMGIAQDATLCGCKADAAMTLIDERFMGIVIASMKGASPPAGEYDAYNTYVAKSNQVCKPNY